MSNEDGWNWVWQRFHGLDPHGIGDVSGDSGATGILGPPAPLSDPPDAATPPAPVINSTADSGGPKIETDAKQPWSLFGSPTPEAAAIAALNYYNPISIADKQERTGVVVGLPYLGYFSLPPTKNGYAGDTNAPVCLGCSNYYHTHGPEDIHYYGEQLSPADRGVAQVPAGGVSGPVPIYLGTPSGGIIVYDSAVGHDRRIK